MRFSHNAAPASCTRIIANDAQGVTGRVWVYVIRNDLNTRPYALIEDLFVVPRARGQHLADDLMREAHQVAKTENCHKVVACSRHDRPWVHAIYRRLGYTDHGIEFRLDL